jgi:amidohydrolase
MCKMKERLINEVDVLREDLISISDDIHRNPELGYQEYRAVGLLTEELCKHGFSVEKGFLDMPTAFKAVFHGKGKGPAIAFMAEYDALPEIGHACGHNLIGAMSIGAAIALSKIMSDIPGQVVVFGTPAEETSGAKVVMAEKGAFDGIDAAMMIHPKDINATKVTSLAMDAIEFAYTGKVAQAAAAPWDGINALDAVIQLFNSVNALRLRLKPEIRIHGIITKGGVAANIIPDKAIAQFYIRGPERKYLNEVVNKVMACAQGSAIVSEATLSTRNYEFSFENLITNNELANAFEANLKYLGVEDIDDTEVFSASTDMGNVSHKVPSIHPNLAIAPKGIVTHSVEFMKAAASPMAHDALIVGAKALSLTGYDVLTDPNLLARIKQEFADKMTYR